MELVAVIVVLVVVVGAALWWRSRRAGGATEAATSGSRPGGDAVDTVQGWEPTATRILTSQERLAYTVLERALPEYVILAQVPLSRFLKVPTRNSYNEWLGRVGQLCADLLVCDRSSTVLAVIDVRVPPQQASDRHKKRHDRMKRVLKAAGIPLHIWFENALPTPEAARTAVLDKMPALAPAVAPAAAVLRGTPPTLDDAAGGVVPDEVIELGEPPPSTWFDNLESRPGRAPGSPSPSPGQPPQQQRPR
jgi:hypothetical protein